MYTVGGLSGIEGFAVELISMGLLWLTTRKKRQQKDTVLLVCEHLWMCYVNFLFLILQRKQPKEQNEELNDVKSTSKKSTSVLNSSSNIMYYPFGGL